MDGAVARAMLVAKVLSADGIMTDDERAFLERAMDALGLGERDRQSVRDLDGWDEAEPVAAELSVDDKRELMDLLEAAVLADGKVSPHETAAIAQLTAALGLD